MESDSSSFTTYSLDISISNFIKRNKEERKIREENVAEERKMMYEDFMTHDSPMVFNEFPGLHFYVFTEKKIKFGFNPCEVAHVSIQNKFICVLKYNRNYWYLGRHTIPSNWLQKVVDLFYGKLPVTDDDLLEVISRIHTIFMAWSKEHEEFRRKKFQKYREAVIDYLELDSEDTELYLDESEREELRQRKERILKRMIPPKSAKIRNRKKLRTYSPEFMPCPSFSIDSD